METKRKVLVIDDSPFIFKAVKRALEPHGFDMVGQAFHGKEGLELVERYQPDVIFLDITMPVMDGLETAKRLFAKDPTLKVIMLSAMGDGELIETARGLGVKDFLAKPFKPDELLQAVNKLF